MDRGLWIAGDMGRFMDLLLGLPIRNHSDRDYSDAYSLNLYYYSNRDICVRLCFKRPPRYLARSDRLKGWRSILLLKIAAIGFPAHFYFTRPPLGAARMPKVGICLRPSKTTGRPTGRFPRLVYAIRGTLFKHD